MCSFFQHKPCPNSKRPFQPSRDAQIWTWRANIVVSYRLICLWKPTTKWKLTSKSSLRQIKVSTPPAPTNHRLPEIECNFVGNTISWLKYTWFNSLVDLPGLWVYLRREIITLCWTSAFQDLTWAIYSISSQSTLERFVYSWVKMYTILSYNPVGAFTKIIRTHCVTFKRNSRSL